MRSMQYGTAAKIPGNGGVPYCIDLIGGPYLETDASVCAAFRPKSALRQPPSP